MTNKQKNSSVLNTNHQLPCGRLGTLASSHGKCLKFTLKKMHPAKLAIARRPQSSGGNSSIFPTCFEVDLWLVFELHVCCRFEWMQNAEKVFISFFVKSLQPEDVNISTSSQSITVEIRNPSSKGEATDQNKNYTFRVQKLRHEIIPEQSSHEIYNVSQFGLVVLHLIFQKLGAHTI